MRVAASIFATVFALSCGGDSTVAPVAITPVVTPVVTTVTLDRSDLTFTDIGQIEALHATVKDQSGNVMSGVQLTWLSSDPFVATVNSTGVVTSTGLGSAQITVSAANQSARVTIAVPPAAKTITIDKASLSFERIGMRDTLRATVHDQAGRLMSGPAVVWTSSILSVATVDAAGVVTSVGLGNAQISASVEAKTSAAPVRVGPPGLEFEMCTGGAPVVALLVEAKLRASINAQLARFSQDLCADGYTAWIVESVPKTPPEIRSYLADALTRSSGRLKGAMLIGDIPHAYQFVTLRFSNPAIPDLREEAISFQYYADLNGTFAKSAGYSSVTPYSFDVHTGDVNSELWIGVLPTYKGSVTATANALVGYFDKNHAYRTGGAKPPRVFIHVNENSTSTSTADEQLRLGYLREGPYAWTPWSQSSNARLYLNTTTAQYSLTQGYADLRNGAGDFFVQDAHGNYAKSGRLTIVEVESNPVKTIFFWSNGCAIGNLDYANNFLTSIVYSPTSSVLVAKGTTNDSGGMGNNLNGYFGRNVAVAMTSGSSFGDAVLSHVNVPLVFPWSDSREFHFGTPIVIGDPTLKLRQ